MIVTYAGNGEFMTVQKALKVGMVISARQWYGETQRLERLHGRQKKQGRNARQKGVDVPRDHPTRGSDESI